MTLIAENGNISLETSTQLIRDGMGGSALIVGSQSSVDSGGHLIVQANEGVIDIAGGTITSQSASLSANDINITSITLGIENTSVDMASHDFAGGINNPGSVTREGHETSYNLAANIDVTETLIITSATDLTIAGANLAAGSDMALTALSGDIDIRSTQDFLYGREITVGNLDYSENIIQRGNGISSGGTLSLQAQNDIDIIGSSLSADENLTLAALAGSIDISSAQSSSFGYHGGGRNWNRSESVVQSGSSLSATQSISLSAHLDVDITTSQLLAGNFEAQQQARDEDTAAVEAGTEVAEHEVVGGNITIVAQSVNISSSDNYYLSETHSSERSGGFFGGRTTAHSQTEQYQIASSLLNGTNNVSAVTSGDIGVLGSGIVSGGNTTLAAGYSVGTDGSLTQIEGSNANVTLQGAIDNSDSFSHTSGSSFFGLNRFSNGFDAHETRNIATSIDAGGNVTVQSTGDTTISGSSVNADENIWVTAGGNVDILAEETEYYRSDYAESSGFTSA